MAILLLRFCYGKISINMVFVFVYTIFDGRMKLVYRLMRFHVQISILSILYGTHLFMNIIVEVKQHVKLKWLSIPNHMKQHTKYYSNQQRVLT